MSPAHAWISFPVMDAGKYLLTSMPKENVKYTYMFYMGATKLNLYVSVSNTESYFILFTQLQDFVYFI